MPASPPGRRPQRRTTEPHDDLTLDFPSLCGLAGRRFMDAGICSKWHLRNASHVRVHGFSLAEPRRGRAGSGKSGVGNMALRGSAPTALGVAGGFVLCLAVSLPGHLSYDSIMQLNEGRRGFYANWHPPMMSWLLGVFDSILPGTALFTSFDIALFFASLAALYHLARNPSPAAAITLAGVILTPQVVLYQ